MDTTNDQDTEDIKDDETSDEQSTETAEITPEKAYELAKGLQKGYTMTRQELADIRANQEAIQEALGNLDQQRKEFGFDEDEDDKPLTRKEFLSLLDEREKAKDDEGKKYQKMIDSQVADLETRGAIKPKEEEDFLNFAVEHKLTDLYQAASLYQEVRAVRQSKQAKAKAELGSKVGTSEKTSNKEQGPSFAEIHSKDWDEL